MDWYYEPDCADEDLYKDESHESLEWIDDLWECYSIERELHNYECKVYNELDRRII